MMPIRDFHNLISGFGRNWPGISRPVCSVLLLASVLTAPAQNSGPGAKPEGEPIIPAAIAVPVADTNTPARIATNTLMAVVETNAAPALAMTNPPALAATLSLTNRVMETAPRTNAAGSPDYASFKILLDRNIFDPTRYPRTALSSRTRTPRRVRTEAFGLVGTISYDKGTIAFFDGSGSEYKKALKVGDSIAGHTVAEIAPDSVKLEAGGRAIDLHIGAQMRKPEQGQWSISGNGEAFSSLNSTNTLEDAVEGVEDGTEAGTPATTAPASSGGESDILKRLMQKRDQELNK